MMEEALAHAARTTIQLFRFTLGVGKERCAEEFQPSRDSCEGSRGRTRPRFVGE